MARCRDHSRCGGEHNVGMVLQRCPNLRQRGWAFGTQRWSDFGSELPGRGITLGEVAPLNPQIGKQLRAVSGYHSRVGWG